ncbi:transmembrane signal receptor [Lithospermum erythrorhizon]|uniref:Transmembrane signal receptor n=1 Tax=Lithospermum erythrorhizon TaxID=34254 RepID=A0AAV3P7D0_LITER
MDVHNAFLHGDLTEEVYMKIPPGFEKGRHGQSYSDYSLFTYSKKATRLNVLVYVDDLIIPGNNRADSVAFKEYLHTCFHMKDLGKLKYFLGIEVAWSREGIFLCQQKYALDIISEAGLLGSKPVIFPMEQNQKLGLSTIHTLSQFLQKQKEDHWVASLRVVRYLKGSPGQGVLLQRENTRVLQGWCHSDWAACPTTRRSVTGWIVFLGSSLVSWKSKKQDTFSLSSAEAEYRAMAKLTCELKWMQGLLECLDVRQQDLMQVHCVSQLTLHLARNPVFHERSKHIEFDCHFLDDALLDGPISASHVCTSS